MTGGCNDGDGWWRVIVLVILNVEGRRGLAAEHARGEGAYLDRALVAHEVEFAVPVASGDNGGGTGGAVDGVGSSDVVTIGGP